MNPNNGKNLHITNYGVMGGVTNGNITIANYGVINLVSNGKKYHFKNVNLTLQNYAMKINVDSTTFNSFDGNATDNSHLVLNNIKSVKFKDATSKLILEFGNNFKFGTGYLFSKLIVDENGGNKLNVDLSRLMPKNDIYLLAQSRDSFIANLAPQYGAVGILHKSNIRTMNNFLTMSNSMIYPHKKASLNRVVKKKRVIRRVKKTANLFNDSSLQSESSVLLSSLRGSIADEAIYKHSPSLAEGVRGWVDSIESIESFESIDSTESIQSLESNESFAYKNNSTDSTNRRRIQTNQTKNHQTSQEIPPTIQSTKNNNYYFILTPFINHNYFFESGRYNLSGFDYGFLTAFSARVAESNSLGAHFAFSYGSLNDKHDKDLSIKSMNFMLGLNYKLDLVYDMFFKARGDVFYFSNALDSATIKNIKPNNLGFGASVSYGKDFDFKQGGILGIEGGIDYKALSANTITLDSMNETYQKSLYNVLYVDLGISYAKYFGSFGFNANLGIKGNVSANKLAKSQIRLNNFNRNVDMVLDNDKVLGYANMGVSYVLNHRNFDMEFSLAYYGNFGDRIISNGGGFEWRTTW